MKTKRGTAKTPANKADTKRYQFSDCTIFADGVEKATEFALLFGATNSAGFARATVETIGFIAVSRQFAFAGAPGSLIDFAAVGYSSDNTGIALVRGQAEVAEPSTVVILALALLALTSRRFKKKS